MTPAKSTATTVVSTPAPTKTAISNKFLDKTLNLLHSGTPPSPRTGRAEIVASKHLLDLLQRPVATTPPEEQDDEPVTKVHEAELRERGPGPEADLNRLLALPVIDPHAAPDLTDRFRRKGGTMRLRPIQSAALHQIERGGGLLAPVAVGLGKSLVAFLTPVVLKATRPLLLIPAALREQCQNDLIRYGQHFHVPKDLLIRSYEELSNPRRSGMLRILAPNLIIADEAHKLRHFSSTRVRRMRRYFKENPDCKFIALSGTMTSRSLKDYAHLAKWALGQGSPLPLDHGLLEAWTAALEEGATAPLAPICQKHGDPNPRSAFRRHLTSSIGVVATSDAEVGSSLILTERDLAIPKKLATTMQEVARTFIAPNGDELEGPLARDRVLDQLVCGFFYYWDWSPAPWRGVPDKEWLVARSAWHKAVRLTLESSFAVEGLDSPMLLAKACMVGKQVPPNLLATWKLWEVHRHKATPPTLAKWVDDYLITDAIEWAAAQDDPPLLWYTYKVVAEAVVQQTKWARFGAGEVGAKSILAVRTPVIGVASVASHGGGKNLQVWGNQALLGPIASATTLEQLLGRSHRTGQARDEVNALLYTQGPFGAALQQAMVSARYIEQTTGQAQRLCYAARILPPT